MELDSDDRRADSATGTDMGIRMLRGSDRPLGIFFSVRD